MKIISYILSPIFLLIFGIILGVFHLIQWTSLKLGGYKGHKRSVDIMNLFLMHSLRVLGTSYKIHYDATLPTDKPIIFVANHQSMFDISPMIWKFRKHHPKFVSKKELGKGLPSISFNLKHGGSVLIDRKNPVQAVQALKDFGVYINKNNYSVVIFPEGTRSRDGKLKPFKAKGLKTLIENIPEAHIVPVSINNTWKVTRFGKFPMGLGTKVSFHIHEPIVASSMGFGDLFEKVEKTVASKVVQN